MGYVFMHLIWGNKNEGIYNIPVTTFEKFEKCIKITNVAYLRIRRLLY
jgi:hypothetical protein